MKNFKLFCFGFGQVAKYFIKNLINNNFNFELFATNTKGTQIKEFNKIKYKSYFFYDNTFDPDLINDLNSANKVLISIPPRSNIDLVIKNFEKNFKKNKFDWVTYLSATSVYGDKKGQWVDETTDPKPTSDRGVARLNAERNWLKLYKNFSLPIQIFRLSGIYSNENNVFERLKMGKLKIVDKKNHFFSRIHIDDIAGVLTLSLKKFVPGEIYNISDNYPCSNEEIARYAADLMKIDLPKKINIEDLESEMLKIFYKESKRVNNSRMKNFFGYKLKYPTYKEGLDMIRNHQV